MRGWLHSCKRIRLIAANTFLEAVRQKVFHFLVILSLSLVGSILFFREFDFGHSELKFIVDCGFGAILFFGAILTVVGTAQLFFSEIENRTALTLLAKPVFKAEFVFGKFCGIFLLMLIFVLLMVALLSVVIFWRESTLGQDLPYLFNEEWQVVYSDIFLYGFLQWLKFGILSAITIFIASFSNTNLYTVVVSFFVMVICQIQYIAREAWHDLEFLPLRWFVQAVGYLFPNFQLFNGSDQLVFGEGFEPSLWLRVVLYALVYIFVFNGLALYSFNNREI